MIGSIHEFVLAVRKQLDDHIAAQDDAILTGKLIDHDSGNPVETSGLNYAMAVSFRNGLRYAKTEIIDELVKRMNEGGL